MKEKIIILLTAAMFLLPVQSGYALVLCDWAFNLDGAVYIAPDYYSEPDTGQLPAYVDDTAFDWSRGIGAVSIEYDPGIAGDYSIGLFLDHEIDEAVNTFYNEFGDTSGVLADGQSWEIDEPGWVMGDIFYNFEDAALDNTNAIDSAGPDDVSMALGWDFSLAEGESALITFYLSELMPDDFFYLMHTDPDSDVSLYFSSTIDIDGGSAPIPEPATIMLLGVGLLGMANFGRKKLST